MSDIYSSERTSECYDEERGFAGKGPQEGDEETSPERTKEEKGNG